MKFLSSLLTVLAGVLLISFVALQAKAAGVRSAQHSGYARLVFDFDVSVAFQAEIVGERLVIQFQQPYTGPLDAAALKGLSGYIVQPSLSNDKRTLTFDIKRSLTIKSFTHKQSAVIDLLEAAPSSSARTPSEQQVAASQTAKTPAVAKGDAAPNVPVRVGSHADFVRLVFDWDRATDYDVKLDNGVALVRFSRDGQIDEAAVKRQLPQAIGDWDLDRTKDGLTVRFVTPEGAKSRHYRNNNRIVVDILTRPDARPVIASSSSSSSSLPLTDAAPNQRPSSLATASQPTTASAPMSALGRSETVVALPPPLTPPVVPASPPTPIQSVVIKPVVLAAPIDVPVTATSVGKAIALRFPWQSPPSAALFVRGRSAYLVFNQPARLDLTSIKKKGDKTTLAEQITTHNGTMARIALADGVVPSLDRDDRGWTLNLRPLGARRPDVGLPIKVEADSPEGGKVRIDILHAAQPLEITDPESGEKLQVIATSDAGKGVDGERQFAQFRILPSLQGVVVLARIDGLDISVTPSHMTIAGGLMVSRLTGKSGIAQAYQFSRWRENDVDFIETKQALQRAAAEGNGSSRSMALFELAQFFLAHGHVPDSLSAIAHLVESQESLENDAALKALRGAALVLKGAYAAALEDLNDPRLDKEASVLDWRGLAKAKLGDWGGADEAFRKAGTLGKQLPAPMAGEIVLAAAQAAMHSGDLKRSRQLTDSLATPEVAPDLRARGELVRAEGYLKAGDKRSALLILERVMRSENREIRGMGTSLWVEQKLADGSLPLSEAIDRLEKVRYGWGGGDLEYQALRQLGQLYYRSGDVRTALERWKEAVTFFPKQPDNPRIRESMTDAFVSLYDRATRDRVAPLTALAMYDDFRDLTPSGERGDRMIQDLADRLVSIDLLDRAAALLEYQIRSRLTGVDRAKVGLRLALVQMIDRQPAKALEALSLSEVANMPADLVAERKRMRAQALMEIGNLTGALAAFETDGSMVADELRAEIYRRGKKWPEAVKALQRVVATAKDGPLDVTRQKAVLNLAIARVLAQEDEGVRRMREEFGPRMQASAHKQAFDVLTAASSDITGLDVVAITQRFADLAEFQTAMAQYREKLRNDGLSSIN